MLQTAEPDTLELLDFQERLEDCCDVLEGVDDHPCDSAADFRIAVTCDNNHTRNILVCSPHLQLAEREVMACLACEKLGLTDSCGLQYFTIVLAVVPLKR